jgi:metal-dependent amidase/aminoacylase/carboxypeptidase family protein
MISEIMQDLGYRVRTCVGKTGMVAETMGGTHEIRFQDGYPPTSNNLDMVELIKGVASKIIGPQNIAKPSTKYCKTPTRNGVRRFRVFCPRYPWSHVYFRLSH